MARLYGACVVFNIIHFTAAIIFLVGGGGIGRRSNRAVCYSILIFGDLVMVPITASALDVGVVVQPLPSVIERIL